MCQAQVNNVIYFLQGDIDYDSSSVVVLSHSLGSTNSFEPRGQISVRSLKSGSLNIQQDSSFELKDIKVLVIFEFIYFDQFYY